MFSLYKRRKLVQVPCILIKNIKNFSQIWNHFTNRGDDGANFLKNRQQKTMSELDEQLAEYIAEWRKQRSKEDEELRKLKDKQSKRKVNHDN